MAKRKKKSLLARILRDVSKAIMAEPAKVRRNAMRRERSKLI